MGSAVRDLEFGIQGLGLGDKSLGFGVRELGSGVQSLDLGAHASGFGVQDLGFRVQDCQDFGLNMEEGVDDDYQGGSTGGWACPDTFI